MVDFTKLQESKGKPRPVNPRDTSNGLPKPPGINDLYASQAEVLDAWFPRRTEKDVVVKLHTGGGKTLVALLMAQPVMNDIAEPVIYLSPSAAGRRRPAPGVRGAKLGPERRQRSTPA